MSDQYEFFSVYGNASGYAERRQEGFKRFSSSIPRTVTTAAWAVFGSLIAGGLALFAESTVPQAHAGAEFVLRHLIH